MIMLLKAQYLPEENQPHSCLTHHFTIFDEESQPIPRVKEFDTETLVAIQVNGTAVNADHFGWFPPSQEQLELLLLHLPRHYHYLVQVQLPEPCHAQG